MFLEVIEMIIINVIDGIPCIIVEKGIICSREKNTLELTKSIVPKNFTKHQESKESVYYKKVLGELKKLFREK